MVSHPGQDFQRHASSDGAGGDRPENLSPDEWALRCELAACYRLFVRFGWTDLISTHLSARVPGAPRHYLINPYGLLFDEVTPSNLIKVDFDGNVVAGDYPYNQAGHEIHSAVLAARPDVDVVLHSHTRAGIAVSAMAEGLLPLSQHAMEILELVCYHRYYFAPDGGGECERLAADLADRWLMIMHNHGLLACGRSVAEAFYFLYTLEVACKVQVDVMTSGGRPVLPSADAVESIARHTRLSRDGPHAWVDDGWRAMLRALARDGIDWKA